MKRLFNVKVLSLFMMISVVLLPISCSDDDPQRDPSIVELAVSNPNLSSLVEALTTFDDLTDLLSADGSYTVFAPTNDAFDDLLDALGLNSVDEIPEETLRDVLEYHVIASDAVLSTELASGGYTTALGPKIYVSVGPGVFINGTTTVTGADVQASNGVVHVINQVLLPPLDNIAGIVSDYASDASAPEFTQLLAALARTDGQAGGNDLLAAVSTTTGELTVFAPTDAAFEALYDALGVNGVDDIALETLIAVLKHHVVGSRVFSTDLSSGAAATLNGNVTVNTTNLTITGGSGGANIANLQTSLLNINATNGVIHVIDRVLLP